MIARSVSLIGNAWNSPSAVIEEVCFRYLTKRNDILVTKAHAISELSLLCQPELQYVIKASHCFILFQCAGWEVQSNSELKVETLGDKERYAKLVSM